MSPKRDLPAQVSGQRRESEDGRALMAEVARQHYLDRVPNVEIAQKLGISRFKVARLLERALDEGMVTITINDLGLEDAVLSDRLRDHLGLEECQVIRSHGDEATIRTQVGAAAADLLTATLEDDDVLGLTWGRTLTATTTQLHALPRLTVVQLTGSVSGGFGSSPIEILRTAALRSGGAVYPIFSPLIVEDAQTAASLRQHPEIRTALDHFPTVTTAVTSVGSWEPPSSQVREVMAPDDLAHAEERGCVADIAGILIAADGSPVDLEFQQRCVSVSYEQLRSIPRVLAVAGGAEKADAIRAVAQGGLITGLVTDHHLALKVLEAEQE